jgi:hypothetical protein
MILASNLPRANFQEFQPLPLLTPYSEQAAFAVRFHQKVVDTKEAVNPECEVFIKIMDPDPPQGLQCKFGAH